MTKRIVLSVCIVLIAVANIAAQEQEDALAAYRNGAFEESVRICLLELESMPRNMNSYTVLGWSLIALGRYQEALEYSTRAHEIVPLDYRIVEILGEAHYYLGNNVQALDFFEQYAELGATGDRIDNVYAFMGEIYIRLEEYNHADIALSAAVYHDSNVSLWWARLGYAREMAGDLAHALEAYNRALQLNPALNDARRGRDRVQSSRENG